MKSINIIKKTPLLILLFSFVLINIKISEMTYFGAIINVVPLLLFLLPFNISKFEKIVLFYILNVSIGPFLLANLGGLELVNIGRLDYFVSNVLFFYLCSKGIDKRIFYFIFLLLLSIFISFLFDPLDLFEKVNVYYAFLSKISTGFVLYFILINVNLVKSHYVKSIVFLILLLHLLLSFTQLFYPLYIRSGSISAGLHIAGFLFTRPLGLLESSYVYAVNTIFLVCILFGIYGRKSGVIFISLFLIIFSFLSTRSSLLGILAFLIIYLVSKRKYEFKIFMFILVALFVYYWSSNNLQSLLLDQSNSTKILLWYLTIKSYILESNIIQMVFGFGTDSASFISNDLPNFAGQLNYDVLYDNRVDSSLGLGFPIHNVYIQALYEHGLFVFVLLLVSTIKLVNKIIKMKVYGLGAMFCLVVVFQYLLHNDIFSPYLILILILGQRKEGYDKKSSNNLLGL